MMDALRLVAAVSAGPIIAVGYCSYVHWRLARRLRAIERSRASIATSEPYKRIWRSVEFTEQQRRRESALMAAIDSERPVQLYRREGRRFIAHGDAA